MGNSESGKKWPKDESQPPHQCPIPSAHDKLDESHYFIHQLVEHYHQPHQFRYSLSAFFQAARSATLMIQKELGHEEGFAQWWQSHQEKMANDSDLKQLNAYRVQTFHTSSLIPSSTMFVGHFKYGKRKLGILDMPVNPMTDSLTALMNARRQLSFWEDPHRTDMGEEFGIQREWQLAEIPSRELVSFCIECWEKIMLVVKDVHKWKGGTFESEECKHHANQSTEYRSLRESEIFPEVEKAWGGPPTERLEPGGNIELKLLADPWDDADILHTVKADSFAKGWIGGQSQLWDRRYGSMIIYRIGDKVVFENTCVFFEIKAARIFRIEDPIADYAAHEHGATDETTL